MPAAAAPAPGRPSLAPPHPLTPDEASLLGTTAPYISWQRPPMVAPPAPDDAPITRTCSSKLNNTEQQALLAAYLKSTVEVLGVCLGELVSAGYLDPAAKAAKHSDKDLLAWQLTQAANAGRMGVFFAGRGEGEPTHWGWAIYRFATTYRGKRRKLLLRLRPMPEGPELVEHEHGQQPQQEQHMQLQSQPEGPVVLSKDLLVALTAKITQQVRQEVLQDQAGKLEELREELGAKAQETDAKVNSVEAGLRETNAKVEAGLRETNAKVNSVEAGLRETNAKVNSVEAGLRETDAKVNSVEAGLRETNAKVEAGLRETNAALNNVRTLHIESIFTTQLLHRRLPPFLSLGLVTCPASTHTPPCPISILPCATSTSNTTLPGPARIGFPPSGTNGLFDIYLDHNAHTAAMAASLFFSSTSISPFDARTQSPRYKHTTVVLLGCSGTGKTTFARALAGAALSQPGVELTAAREFGFSLAKDHQKEGVTLEDIFQQRRTASTAENNVSSRSALVIEIGYPTPGEGAVTIVDMPGVERLSTKTAGDSASKWIATTERELSQGLRAVAQSAPVVGRQNGNLEGWLRKNAWGGGKHLAAGAMRKVVVIAFVREDNEGREWFERHLGMVQDLGI